MRKLVRRPKLTDRQELFCKYFVEGYNQTQACAMAYPEQKDTKRYANLLMKSANVKEMIREMSLASAQAEATTLSMKTIIFLCQHAEKEEVRLKAAMALDDRFGYGKVINPDEEQSLSMMSIEELELLAREKRELRDNAISNKQKVDRMRLEASESGEQPEEPDTEIQDEESEIIEENIDDIFPEPDKKNI